MMIFTECINCGPICKIALESFHKHHDQSVVVYGTPCDFELLGSIANHPNTICKEIKDEILLSKFRHGHKGTAALFSKVCKYGDHDNMIIHFDADIYFKRECLSEVVNALEEGYDIIGTRRCYGHNPGGVKGLENFPDTISTYFMGIDVFGLLKFDEDELSKMWQGVWHPLGWPILDFGDAVTHSMLDNGAKIKYLDWNKFGSQNEQGKKTNDYELNLHMDCGSNLIHCGGVGSGYAYFNNKSNPEKSYAEWALGRWALFAKVFYNEDIGYNEPTVYGPDNRWVSGNYDEHILQLVKKEIE